eukprot:CAMPEP_0174859282 /NCGR_PEP_ID=MMETSP1114-20130205/45943_1 /TAXON_ID=312471 /ORGANISM="Neobodo designis, Strain CCAP 1951/1" /LENGTH=46 /DNA_ID= /DNA_START= /DNA_END= /DNA_ORIENTATION=
MTVAEGVDVPAVMMQCRAQPTNEPRLRAPPEEAAEQESARRLPSSR